MVLAAVERLGPGCRVSDVKSVVEDRVDRGLAFGAVFTTLDRLEAKGLVTWRLGDPIPTRGGRAPRLYAVTFEGVAALAEPVHRIDAGLDLADPGPPSNPNAGERGELRSWPRGEPNVLLRAVVKFVERGQRHNAAGC